MEPVRVTVARAYDDGIFTLALSDEDGVGALLFSRSDTIDEQDSLLGMDTYSISTHDGATVYGGVESAKLNWTNLEVQLTAEAAAALGLSRKLVLLVANLDEAESARDGLRRVGIVATAA